MTKGGKREGAGRKEVDPKAKKKLVQVYVEGFKIEEIGGMPEAKKAAKEGIESKWKSQKRLKKE